MRKALYRFAIDGTSCSKFSKMMSFLVNFVIPGVLLLDLVLGKLNRFRFFSPQCFVSTTSHFNCWFCLTLFLFLCLGLFCFVLYYHGPYLCCYDHKMSIKNEKIIPTSKSQFAKSADGNHPFVMSLKAPILASGPQQPLCIRMSILLAAANRGLNTLYAGYAHDS